MNEAQPPGAPNPLEDARRLLGGPDDRALHREVSPGPGSQAPCWGRAGAVVLA